MRMTSLLKSGGLAAVAMALAAMLAPAPAMAQQGNRGDNPRAQRTEQPSRVSPRVDRGSSRADWSRGRQAENRAALPSRQPRAQSQSPARAQAQAQRVQNRVNRPDARTQQRDWNRGDRAPGQNWNRGDGRRDNDRAQNRGTWRDDRNNRAGNQRDWRGDRNNRADNRRDWRNDRNNRAENRRDWRNDRNNSWRSDRGNSWRDPRRDNRQWDRRWRDNNRYNWHSYRQSNRSIFSPGRYYAPVTNYNYRRLSIGITLGSPFYSNRYWINDPWQYRLPAVYGSYRWVRYYDDVLLIDTYTGEVVDVIYDFFW